MKMRDIISNEKCYTKDMYKDFSEKKEKNYYNGIVIRELFKQYGLNYKNSDVMKIVKDTMPNDLFHTSREEIINTTLLVLRLNRFQDYYTKKKLSSTTVVHNGGTAFVTNHNIQVDYNLLIEDGVQVTIVKVKNKKCDLSAKGKTIFTKVSDNMELFLLQEVAKKVLPGKLDYTAKIIFLRHPNDKDVNLVPSSDFESNKTVVSASFLGNKMNEMLTRLDNIMKGTSTEECLDCSVCSYNLLCKYKKDNTNLLVIPKKAKASSTVTFTKNQIAMIEADAGIYRVLAGAGSGKTTCIANRICKLLEKNVLPQNILLITYTTKAVQEMKEKIDYWLKVNKIKANTKNLNIHTFNGFGYELIKKEYKKFGYTSEPTLIEKSEKISLIKSLLDSKPEIDGFNYKDPVLDMPHAKGVVLMMDDYFTKIKLSGLIYPSDVKVECKIKDVKTATSVLELYLEYTEYMKKNNLVDYMDQINFCYEILKDPINLKKYGFEYIMVDEFQDSDNLQINILMLLSQYPYFKSLMVVGDDSQAIFSWRGATANNIINFHDVFPSAYDIHLVENFRSTIEICNLANNINDINKEKVPKQLISNRSGISPLILNVEDVESFVDKMLESILYYGYQFSDVALIARNKKDLLAMQKILIDKNVPCVLSVSELLIDNPVIQHLIDFAKYLQDLSSDLYFAEFLQISDYNNYMSQNKSTLGTYVKTQKDAFEQELIHCNSETEKIDLIIKKFEKIAVEERSVKSLVDILKSKHFITLNHMCQFLIDMDIYKADYTIEKLEEPVNAITLTTAHSSKGREWTFVGIYLNSFSYPLSIEYNQVKNLHQYEEERRLLFVAITRAKEQLFLCGDAYKSSYQEVAKALNKK